MIDSAPAPDGGLPAYLAAHARRTPDGPLAIAALAGSGAVILAFWWGGPLWPATLTLPLCVAAFGFWGILDRELSRALGVEGHAHAQHGHVHEEAEGLGEVGLDFDQAIQQLDYAKRRAGGNFPLASQIDQRQREIMEQQRMVQEMMGR